MPDESSPGEKAIYSMLQIMNSQTATLNGLTALHGTIKRETQEAISVAVDPLRDEMRDLTDRVQRLDMGGCGQRHLSLMNRVDVAHRRMVFIGSEVMDTSSREADIHAFASTLGADFQGQPGHFFSVPRNSRKITRVSYLEFGTLEKVNLTRNWALRTATELIKKAPGCENAQVDFRARQVRIGDVTVFEQSPGDLEGTFKGSFSHLRFP
ncbi:unnamed protein product [Prorocentrum cordatum]|uniref:Uncharacterized protein n=1 Tax=Prorocentrum cordatum TaxID=2364126 RepID=A0ABN9VYF2_9DINO|nr:unnamed protein product [Polarella glacialis]